MSPELVIEKLVEKIEYEEGVRVAARLEVDMHSTTNDQQRHLWRDIKRSESKILAFEEVLDLVLPAIGWTQGAKQYLKERAGVV